MQKPEKKPSGGQSTYTDEKAAQVLARVADGEPLAAVCRDMKIGLTTWYDWTYARPALAEAIARAREVGEEVILADTMAISDEPPPMTALGSIDSGAIQHAKLRIETRLKLLAKWNPKKWGERVQSDVRVTGLGDILATLDGHALKPVTNAED